MGRQISQQEGKEMAEKWSCPTIETSAKHNENVGKCPFLSYMSLLNVLFISFTIAKIFDLLIAEIEKANNPPSEEKNGCVIS